MDSCVGIRWVDASGPGKEAGKRGGDQMPGVDDCMRSRRMNERCSAEAIFEVLMQIFIGTDRCMYLQSGSVNLNLHKSEFPESLVCALR